jgi:hypothetical protein
MQSLPVLTIADLRGQSITDWEQQVTMSIPFGHGDPIKVVLAPGLVVPRTMFKYQLQQAIYEGSANGGVRWWCKRVALPSGAVRQAKFDISVRFECPHARVKYKKKATKDTRKSKHLSCVDCPAFVRFKGCCATDDSSVALVVTAKFIQVCHDPLRQLRKEFEQLNSCVSAEILASDRFAFVFQNCCQAEDAHVAVHGKEHGHFHGKLRAETQNRFIFSVYKCNLKHERHLQPCLPSQRGMYMSYAVSQEVANMAAARVLSHATTTEWTKRFELVEAVMMPKPLQTLKNQVLLGASCLQSDKTKAYICTKSCTECSICMKYLSDEQKKTLSSSTQRLHMKCFVDEELTKKVRFSKLDTEFVTLLRTAPKPKNWRVVTCNMESCGCRMLCSCGYGMRHMTCCLHVSMGIQKASNYSCFGCEEETIHVRHTSMYAALRNIDVVKRTHDDWKGVICKSLESKDIEAAFPELSMDEDQGDDAMDDEPPAPHQHGTRLQQGRRDKNADELAYKAEKIAALKSRFFEAVNVLEAA